ncbi:hypothetical protein [Microseira sp. BLCC-F43]|uniref:hypothetical protein n=1 Tax=Microseira sp. BLCC-F43 TaxID=3153602 RepID=UPI0035B6E20D
MSNGNLFPGGFDTCGRGLIDNYCIPPSHTKSAAMTPFLNEPPRRHRRAAASRRVERQEVFDVVGAGFTRDIC